MSSYWRKREAENLANNLKDEKAYKKELDRIYKDMLDACQKEIDSFYGRYADKEGISIAAAKKRVSKLDIEAYERKAEKYVKEKNFSKQANEEMRLYNLTMKVNRLEMLKANIGLELIAGHDELNKFMEKILKGRTEDELKRQAGILGKSIRDNAKLANSIVNGDFHNAKFSQRLWANQSEMKADLSKMLEKGMLQGKNARTLTKDLRQYFIGDGKKVGKNYATERLLITELARVQTEAQKQSFIANGFKEYTFIVNGGCCDICAGLAGKHFPVEKMMPGENAPPMHPFCRCSIAAYEDSADYEAWLTYLDKGGTTEAWNKLSKAEKMAWIRKQKAEALKLQEPEIRKLPEIEYEESLQGIIEAPTTAKLETMPNGRFKLTLAKRETVEWKSMTDFAKRRVRWAAPARYEKEFFIDKGEYDLQPYVKTSEQGIERQKIAQKLGAEYVGTAWFRKYNAYWEVDVYSKGGKILYSFEKAELKRTLTKKSLENVLMVAKDREKTIGEKLKEKGIRFARLKARQGDDWVETMKEFHKIIKADGKPTVLSDAEYDAIKGEVLYRGIAPASHLRSDITNKLTPQQMADGFFTDNMPFPSRGIYGDGIAYCSPSIKVGAQYASSNWSIDRGGKIIEFKIKPNAKTISYEDAVELFETVAHETDSNLLFNKDQRRSKKEVGKAMNALGYDVIIKENGDGIGVPFYVILNRECLVTKENWTTVTVTPEWLRKVGRRW